MAASGSGRGAETVYRNRDGKRIEREEWVDLQQKKRKKRVSEYPEQELEWGGGLKQRNNTEEEKAEISRIAAQPFARFEPDEKYMKELKARQDWNDPMRKFEEQEVTAPTLQGKAAADAQPRAVERPKCPHPPWQNRYEILPGYRWDGKVRGNGFEKEYFHTKNTREFERADAWRREMANDDN
ncbi:CWC26 [Symbiodinium sp. CCMP2592]|nr:CWC26 [Symbiodinium sp. CCMP2592]